MTISMIVEYSGGHIGFLKMPTDEFLHTLRKIEVEVNTNSNQSRKKVCQTFPPYMQYDHIFLLTIAKMKIRLQWIKRFKKAVKWNMNILKKPEIRHA